MLSMEMNCWAWASVWVGVWVWFELLSMVLDSSSGSDSVGSSSPSLSVVEGDCESPGCVSGIRVNFLVVFRAGRAVCVSLRVLECSCCCCLSIGGGLCVAVLFVRRRLCVLEITCVHALFSSRWLHSASPVLRCWTLSIVQLVVGQRGGLVLRVRVGWSSTCASSLDSDSAFGAGGCAFCVAFRLLMIALLPICSHSESVVAAPTFCAGGCAFCADLRPLVAALLPICSHSKSFCRCCVCVLLCVLEHCLMWSCSRFPVVVYRCLHPGVEQPCGNHFFTSFGT